MNPFSNYALYYDLLYSDKDYNAESIYIDGLLKKYAPAAKNLLSLGCGTGKHEVILARNGFSVTGIDRSDVMIGLAEKNGAGVKNACFFTGNILRLQLGKKFDAAVSLFHVANYQNTDDDLLLFFKTAASHLHKNGIFIFDSWYGPAVLADPPCKRTKKFENDRFQIVRNGVPKHITKKKFVHVYFTLNITDKHTGEKSTIEETHSMRYLFTDELEKFIRPNHMALIHREQWMTGFPPSDKTWYVTYVVKKL